VFVGMGVHVALDLRHETRMGRARTAALERDAFCCRGCGRAAPDVGTHIWHQPRLLPSYRAENLIALCAPCHELAHRDGGGAGSWS
jgi:hypothetical protein